MSTSTTASARSCCTSVPRLPSSPRSAIAASMAAPAADRTVECDGMGNVFDYLTWQSSNASAAASDLCGSVSWSSAVDSTFDACDGAVGGSIVVFTATDACGNSASTTATYTIQDTQAPVIELDSLVEVMCADYSDTIPYGFSASDICSDVTVAIADTETEGPCAGAFEREYTVTDACGNATRCIGAVLLDETDGETVRVRVVAVNLMEGLAVATAIEEQVE